MKTVYDLMCVTARHLTGKSVRVRMTKPEGFNGLCWIDETGRLTIDINPDLSDKGKMYVYLHELSHALHHRFKPVTEAVMTASQEDLRAPSYQLKERQADEQAYTWLEYGEKHRDKSLDYFEGMLWALLDYKDGLR